MQALDAEAVEWGHVQHVDLISKLKAQLRQVRLLNLSTILYPFGYMRACSRRLMQMRKIGKACSNLIRVPTE